MCDEDSFRDMLAYELRCGMSRREFGAGLGAGFAALLAGTAGAQATGVSSADVDIRTPDGSCDAFFAHPLSGAAPGVLLWPDIFGLRPAVRQMAQRLAGAGYAVLSVNPFYRTLHAPTAPENPDFNDPPTREALLSLARTLTAQRNVTDAQAFSAWLDQQPQTDRARPQGTLGFCFAGPFTLRTAAALPQRIGAGASFHGGGLVTDKPDSPHLLIGQIKARFLIAIADNDDQKDPQAKDILRGAFEAAHVPAQIEVYKGALHGWCMPDSKVYNQQAAEKAWAALLALFKQAL
ncbi:MAG: dienelactone hydrolase family protein [Proteobacteria bacterium]|nr:dienelactone hydrolase family protein [Pseudomonadota bacterium]